jgi:hypothetical protein
MDKNITKPINDNQIDKPQNAAQKAAKEETSSPGIRRSRAFLFQLFVGVMIAAFAILTSCCHDSYFLNRY